MTLLLLATLLLDHYDGIRQALIQGNLKDAQTRATALAAAAKENPAIAARARDVAKSANLNQAREAFAPLSDEMIKVRRKGDPAVYYCSMVRKSWLQKKGDVGNPYAAGMEKCGELKAE